jgi:BirA family transcriptional regulator, biotin operon repressor / biotin---[acetyl-CoA-carboxylase] ligase
VTVLPDLARAGEAISARGCDLGRPLHLLSETTSTNDEAKRGASSGAAHGATWVAESQTAGRGRQGRAWVSPRGENLLFSVLLRLDAPPPRLPLVSLVAGLAVAEAVERAGTRKPVRLKWPNDVVVLTDGDRARPWSKVAGILVETSMTGSRVQAIVVGVGINVHTRHFPEDLTPFATSIALEADPAPDRAEILADVLAGLDREVAPVLARGLGLIHGRLTQRDVLFERYVRSETGEGVACGIDLEGRLLVDHDGRRNAWNAGEVHLGPRYY